MISTTGMLARNLLSMDDSFLTVEIDGREYIIDHIKHIPDHYDNLSTHVCLSCRDGGDGNIKR